MENENKVISQSGYILVRGKCQKDFVKVNKQYKEYYDMIGFETKSIPSPDKSK